KPSKMIDTRDINQLQSRPHSLNPPLESISTHAIPVEQRIAPVLPGLAEIIRRHARNHHRRSVRIQLKLVGIGPNICGVVRHKNWHVSYNLNPLTIAIRFQFKPLPKE